MFTGSLLAFFTIFLLQISLCKPTYNKIPVEPAPNTELSTIMAGLFFQQSLKITNVDLKNYRFTNTSQLPPGLKMSNGEANGSSIFGYPTKMGTYKIQILAYDKQNQRTYRVNYTLKVEGPHYQNTQYQIRKPHNSISAFIPIKSAKVKIAPSSYSDSQWVQIFDNQTLLIDAGPVNSLVVFNITLTDDFSNFQTTTLIIKSVPNPTKILGINKEIYINSQEQNVNDLMFQITGGRNPYVRLNFRSFGKCINYTDSTLEDLNEGEYVHLKFVNYMCKSGWYNASLDITDMNNIVNYFLFTVVVVNPDESQGDVRLNRNQYQERYVRMNLVQGINVSNYFWTGSRLGYDRFPPIQESTTKITQDTSFRYTPYVNTYPCVNFQSRTLQDIKVSEVEVATIQDVYLFFLKTVDGDILRWSKCVTDYTGRELKVGDKITWRGKLLPTTKNSYALMMIDDADPSMSDEYQNNPQHTDPWPPTYTQGVLYWSFDP